MRTQLAADRVCLGKQRILLMDDDDSVREIAAQMLEFLGYEVDVARDGNQAVTRFKTARDQDESFDAVILDMSVPGGLGAPETVKRLEAIDPKVVALISSGYFNDPAMCEFKQHGFSGVLKKPFRIKALSGVLKQALDTKGLDKPTPC